MAPHPEKPRGYGPAARVVNALAGIVTALIVLGGGAAGAAPSVLALGDSLTAGFGLAPEQAFPVRLQAKLAADGITATVINAGVSGDTTAGGLARLGWALGDHPQYAILELGANDALRGIDPQVTYANLDQILARLKAAGVKTLIAGMRAPLNWGKPYQERFDQIFPALARKYDVPLYPFFLDGVVLDPKLNQGDGLHPTAAGVEVIVGRIAPYVERLLGGAAG